MRVSYFSANTVSSYTCLTQLDIICTGLYLMEWRKANRIGHILRRICILKHIIKGKRKGRIEVTVRRGRICKLLLDDDKEMREYRKLQEEALDGTVWRIGFGSDCGYIVRQTVGLTDGRMDGFMDGWMDGWIER